MAKGLKSVIRAANRVARTMKNGEMKTIPGSRINGAKAVVYRSKGNGMVNVFGASYESGIASYYSDGTKFPILTSNRHHAQAKSLIFSGGAKFKRGSTGSRGG